MERIALISDIHANLPALRAFLRYADEKRVTRILNLGDAVQIGPDPAEVFDIVMNDGRFVNIMGNGECLFFDEALKAQYASESAHREWTADSLGEERLARLRQIPFSRTVEIAGKRFFMIHARMDGAALQPLLYAGDTLDHFLADYGADADYVLFGHTHLPLYAVNWSGRPVINPGSIGCGRDGKARFAVMEIDGELADVSFVQRGYDKDQLIRDFRENAVPCGEEFLSKFYGVAQ